MENKTYLEVFREYYPNVDEKQLFGDYCPAGFFKNGIDDDSSECSGPDRCDECWNRTANSEWFENRDYHYYVPDKWKKAECINEPSDEELEQDRAALKKAISEVNENHIDCPYYKKGAALSYIGYGAVHFECQKHEEEFSDPHKLKVFINNHCYNSAWCNYCQEQEPQDKPAELPAAQSASDTSVFDYSELDSDTAAKLESVTAEIFNVRKDYIFTMAKKVAYAHELLANCGNGKFGAWCESIGITRQTGNNLIKIVKLFDNSTAEEQVNLNKLTDGNIKLLYEAAKPSAPPELVEQVKSGDITTHKEYIKLKKQLEAAEEQNAVLSAEKEQFHRASKANLEKLNEERDHNAKLEQRVKELESRPVDVAVDVDELNRRVAEVTNKMNSEMEHTLAEERRGFADTLNAKDDRIWELEDELAELRDHNTELDFGDGSNSLSADQLSEIYETLHGKVISALKDCKAFISINNLPQIVKDRASGKFGTLKELIEWYIEEME